MDGARRWTGGASVLALVAAALITVIGCDGGKHGGSDKAGKANATGKATKAGKANATGKATKAGKANATGKVAEVPKPARARWRLALVDEGHYGLGGVGYDGAGRWVVTHSRAVEKWSVQSGQPVARVRLTRGGAALAVRPGGKQVALGGSRGQVQLVSFDGSQPVALPKLADWVQDVAFDAKGTRLAAVSQDGVLRVYDLASHKALYSAKSPEKNGFYSVAFLPGGRILVVGGSAQLHLFDLHKGAFTRSVAGPGNAIRSLSLSPKGDRLAAASDRRAWILDTRSWEPVKKLAQGRAPVAFGPKGRWLAVAEAKRQLVIYRAASLQAIAHLGHAAPPWRLAFAPGGDALILATRFDSKVYVYRFDDQPDLGVRIARLQWFDDDGPTLYATLSVVGPMPRDTVAYGRLSGLRATVAGGGAVKRITAPPQQIQGMAHRDRVFPGTSRHGFSLNLRLHGIGVGAKRLARLEGTFLMRVARKSALLRFEPLDTILGKPLSHPVLKKMGLRVTATRDKSGKAIRVTHQGQLGQLEGVSLLDPEGKTHACSKQRILTHLPTWTCRLPSKPQMGAANGPQTGAARESQMGAANERDTVATNEPHKGWKLSLRVNADTHLVRAHFAFTRIALPPHTK